MGHTFLMYFINIQFNYVCGGIVVVILSHGKRKDPWEERIRSKERVVREDNLKNGS